MNVPALSFILKKNKHGLSFLLFFLIALFIRLPFFFRDYIDHDESTFIIMGQSIVDGYLPYTKLWDLKPPLLFYFFSAVISLFGKSLIAIRLVGTLIVACSALYVLKITEKLTSKKLAIRASIIFILCSSLFGSIQGVMSEHISLLFFLPGLYLLIAYKNDWIWLLGAMLLGCSIMVKLNLAYPVFLIILFLVIRAFLIKKNLITAIKTGVILSLGVCIVVFATIVPYLLTSQFMIWWDSVIMAATAYNPLPSIVKRIIVFLMTIPLLWLIIMLYKKQQYYFKGNSTAILLVVCALTGIVASFIDVGKINTHYLIQFYPFVIILISIWCYRKKVERLRKINLYFFLLILLASIESYLEYKVLIQRFNQGQSLYNDEGFEIPKYFKENGINPDGILFMKYHIGYWIMNETPPCKTVTHPSNLYREELFPYMGIPSKTTKEEILRIFNQIKPEYIVVPLSKINNSESTDPNCEDIKFFYNQVHDKYILMHSINNVGIYRSIESFMKHFLYK